MERFVVIGLGRFGSRLATMLAEGGADVIAVDRSRDLVEQIRDSVTLAVCLDCTNEEAIRAQGIDKVDVAIVGIGQDFEDAALITVLLKHLGVPKVISRATTSVRGQILSRIGADGVVNPERESAERWCSRLLAPAIIERIELAEGFSLAQIAAPPAFCGKTLEQLEVRKKHHVNVVAIRRSAEQTDDQGRRSKKDLLISVPMADTVVEPGDVLLLIGGDDALAAFPAK